MYERPLHLAASFPMLHTLLHTALGNLTTRACSQGNSNGGWVAFDHGTAAPAAVPVEDAFERLSAGSSREPSPARGGHNPRSETFGSGASGNPGDLGFERSAFGGALAKPGGSFWH